MRPSLRVRPLHAALIASLALPVHAFAQSAGPDTPQNAPQQSSSQKDADSAKTLGSVHVTGSVIGNSYDTDNSTIGAKAPAALRDIPQSVVVINRSLLDAQGATSFQDALRNVPGITITAAEGGTIGDNINLRGFTARTDIYLDGFRDRGQYYRDTFDLAAIEVLKGPSSMLFGRGSTGGVINQVSKQAELTPSAEISTTVGSDDHYRVSGDFDTPFSDTSAGRLNVFAQDIHSTRDVVSNRDGGIAPSLRFGIGTPTEITLSALLQRSNDAPDYGLPPVNGRPANVNHDNYYGFTDDRTLQTVGVFSARIDHKFNDDLELRSQLQYSHYHIDARETAPNSVVTDTGVTLNKTLGNPTNLPLQDLLVQYASHDRVISDRSFDSQTDLQANFDTGSVHHTLITGMELGHDNYDNQGYTRNGLPLVSLLDPPLEAQPANVTRTLGNHAVGDADTEALYANDTMRFNDQWQFVAGLRRDRFAADLSNTVSLPATTSQTVYFTSVRSGLIYQPSEEQSYYVSYGTSFDPSLETLTVTNGTQALAPEKNRSYEVGGKWDLAQDRLLLTAAAFQVTQTNARTETDTGVYELDGNLRVRGIELGATGHITEKWQLFSGYTHLNPDIVKALDGTQGNIMANTPRNSGTVWTTYTVGKLWEFGGGATYQSLRYAANTDLVSVGGYTRWDGTVAYHQPHYDIRFNLLNAFNRKYFVGVIQSDGGRSIPGAGRTELLTVTYKI
jgi:catecholate siderophore receptor